MGEITNMRRRYYEEKMAGNQWRRSILYHA